MPAFLRGETMIVADHPGASVDVVAQTSPTGRYGVALAEIGFAAETSLAGTPTDHLLGVFLCAPARTRHSMAGRHSSHLSGTGTLCVCPAGADYTTEYDAPVAGILLQVSTECLAAAAAELGRHGARLVEDMNGRDAWLAGMAQAMAAEARSGHANGTLLWSSMADALMRHLTGHRLSAPTNPARGVISAEAFRRLDRFIEDRLQCSLDLAQLAAVAGCERHHFAHSFRAAAGISPYRYVVRRRLARAREMLRGKQSIAEVAAETGFSDQSHLTHWTRRVYGATPAMLAGG